jgi:hypothetical protein
VEPEETAVSRQWPGKHVSTEIKSCNRSNGYTSESRGNVGSGVLYVVLSEVIQGEVIGVFS